MRSRRGQPCLVSSRGGCGQLLFQASPPSHFLLLSFPVPCSCPVLVRQANPQPIQLGTESLYPSPKPLSPPGDPAPSPGAIFLGPQASLADPSNVDTCCARSLQVDLRPRPLTALRAPHLPPGCHPPTLGSHLEDRLTPPAAPFFLESPSLPFPTRLLLALFPALRHSTPKESL